MHGPPPSWAGGVPQTWPSLPRIAVIDTVALGLKPRRAKKWRALRDWALAEWTQAGLLFSPVTEADAALFPELDLNATDAQLEEVIVDRHIRLMTMAGPFGGRIPAVGAWMPNTDPGAFAAFFMGTAWWLSYSLFTRRRMVVHEIGHALGLNHRADVRTSVMYSVMDVGSTVNVPDIHDLESLMDYYALEEVTPIQTDP